MFDTRYLKIILVAALLSPLGAIARPTPAYLLPNHPAPTGHFDYQNLVEHTREYDQFEWLWVRDHEGHQGWVLKSAVLLPLDFSRRARITRNHLIYEKPRHDEKSRIRLRKTQEVTIVAREREWFKISYKVKEKNYTGWVKDEHLRPSSKDPGLFMAKATGSLRQKPTKKSKRVAWVSVSEKMVPLKIAGDWAYVQYGKRKGYFPLEKVYSRLDAALKVRTNLGYKKPSRSLFKQKIVEIFSHPLWLGTGSYSLDVKAKPDMSSANVVTIAPWKSMILQGYAVQRWGKSLIPREGELWWPAEFIEANVDVPHDPSQLRYRIPKASVLFKGRSPVVKGLRFVSTRRGVYRSYDGRRWEALKDFDRGHPISISKNGTLFIGDKVSFDHGKTFSNYIRWDKILALLPENAQTNQDPIRIVGVEPGQKNLNRIMMTLKVGFNNNVKFYTADFGQSWSLL